MPVDPFDYTDFRRFLEDWFIEKKRETPAFSHRAFAKRVGSRDPSVLSNVLKGRRRLSRELTRAFGDALDLDPVQVACFTALVEHAQAESVEERERTQAALVDLQSQRRGPNLDAVTFRFLSRWYHPALYELAGCAGFTPEPAWIAAHLRPQITEDEARAALALLLELGQLVREGDRVVRAELQLATSPSVHQFASWPYHAQGLDNARGVLERIRQTRDPRDGRETAFLGFAAAVPTERLPELRRMLWEAQARVAAQCDAWSKEAPPDRVVQLEIQMFPVSD